MTRVADHGVRYQCGGCGGRLFGLSPFEQLLQEGVGAHLWVASKSGAPGVDCPFCTHPMRQPTAEASLPAGLAACHTCQQVWVPASASDWMAAHLAAGAALPSADPQLVECSLCGAPFQPDDDGRCRYCRAQIAAPAPIVVLASESPGVPAATGVLGSLVSLFTQPVD
jgi:hypothetical protein